MVNIIELAIANEWFKPFIAEVIEFQAEVNFWPEAKPTVLILTICIKQR